jgi:hypothetical protein
LNGTFDEGAPCACVPVPRAQHKTPSISTTKVIKETETPQAFVILSALHPDKTTRWHM